MNGSTRPVGLERLKLDNGYVGNAQRRPPPSVDDGSSNGTGGEDHSEVAERDNNNNKHPPSSRRISAADDDELVDGWPKWLTDNISKDVLAGLVPKSADSYDKLDKVCFLCSYLMLVT